MRRGIIRTSAPKPKAAAAAGGGGGRRRSVSSAYNNHNNNPGGGGAADGAATAGAGAAAAAAAGGAGRGGGGGGVDYEEAIFASQTRCKTESLATGNDEYDRERFDAGFDQWAALLGLDDDDDGEVDDEIIDQVGPLFEERERE